jgi:hypothetical protein
VQEKYEHYKLAVLEDKSLKIQRKRPAIDLVSQPDDCTFGFLLWKLFHQMFLFVPSSDCE